MREIDFLPPIKLDTKLKVSQVLPYLEEIASMSNPDLNLFYDRDMQKAWNEFRYILIICEQYVNKHSLPQKLQYWVKKDWEIAVEIYNRTCGKNVISRQN